MSSLSKPKNILIGVTGGISAYKAADVVSALVNNYNVDVKVVMTENAKKFITPFTLSILSKNKVYDDAAEWDHNTGAVQHIELSKWAHGLAIIPATANTIAKFATGYADNLLSSIFLAREVRALIFPAMNTKMYENQALQANIKLILTYNKYLVKIIPPIEGILACGEKGIGKLPDTRSIVKEMKDFFNLKELK